MNWNIELEIAHKVAQMRGWLERERAGALRLRGVDWFAWATAGASGSPSQAAEFGCAEVLVTRDAAYILTDEAEAQRLRHEEVRGSCRKCAWHGIWQRKSHAQECRTGNCT